MREPPAFIPAKPPAPPPAPAPPTESTPVALHFKAETVAQVIRTLAERTGGMVDTFNTNDARWNDQRVMLDSPAPVPFWEAVDRLTAAANLVRTVNSTGPFGVPRSHVQFQVGLGPIASAYVADEGLVTYVGPFRVGPVVVHEHAARVFLRPGQPRAGPRPRAARGVLR